jgi:hypothetical protein
LFYQKYEASLRAFDSSLSQIKTNISDHQKKLEKDRA